MVFAFARFITYGPIRALRNVSLALLLANPVSAATIAALGDSLTQGYGLAPEEGFVPQLQAWLAAQGQTVTIQNAGVSGDTSAGGLARLDWTLAPDVQGLIVTLGANDMLRGIDPAQTRANLDAILQGAKAKNIPVLLTGRWFDADEALRWGIVKEICKPAELLGKAWDLARLLESGPPLVYAAIKEVVREAEALRFQDALNRVTKRQLVTVDRLYSSEDQLEGARAFAEKREPVWKGK